MNQIIIFDTTLRDGEQAPGFSMSLPEKLRIAQALRRLGVDVIEAGFPASSDEDFESVQRISSDVGRGGGAPIICGLARCHAGDIDRTAESLATADRPRIHTFLATSDLHLEKKLRMSRADALTKIREGVSRAREHVADVEFSPEDASRTDFNFLCTAIRTAIDAGATTINLPDTVGYVMPETWERTFRDLIQETDPSGSTTFSAHCHDDLGLAVANSLAAIRGGALQVECTLNGIGERAGNAALEEIVMALRMHGAEYGATTGIDTTMLGPSSRLLSHVTGIAVPPNKAIVGQNAFRHESGIHQHGVLNDRGTYEIMSPEDVGSNEEHLVLGKHSGRHAFVARLDALGLTPTDEACERAFKRFKELCSKKNEIFDADLVSLITAEDRSHADHAQLGYFHVVTGTGLSPTATVRVQTPHGTHWGSGQGDGPVDATLLALEAALQVDITLVDFSIHAATPGSDAQGEAAITLRFGDAQFIGRGASTDSVEATALAAVDAIGRAHAAGAVTFPPPATRVTSAPLLASDASLTSA